MSWKKQAPIPRPPQPGWRGWGWLPLALFLAGFGWRQGCQHPATTAADATHNSLPAKPASKLFTVANPPGPVTIFVPLADPFAESFEQIKIQLDAADSDQERDKRIADFVAAVPLAGMGLWLNYLSTAEPSGLAAELKHQLARKWADRDPQGMANWITITGAGLDMMEDLAVVWVNQNPANALSWGRSLAGEEVRNQVLALEANELVRSDPIQALTVAAELPPDPSRDELAVRAAAEWAVGDPENAVAWAEKVTDENLRLQILAGVAVAWAKQNPAAAANLALTELPAGRLQENTVVSVVQRWAQMAPASTADWVEQFPPGALRQAAIDNLCEQWSQKDAVAAATWRQSL